MGIWLRLVWGLSVVWSLTACAGFPLGDVSHQTIHSLALSPMRASTVGPLAGDYRGRFAVPVPMDESSSLLTVLPTGDFFGSSTLRLSKNEDGSVSVLSDGRPGSLLRGLDPALVNPAVRPFLFPSCEVPANTLGGDRL
ncbi:MAG: hypothetical protein E8D46_17550 [Nitrospira sp.]|nr:MAG: hypothetical protein E8D46_17550 [Nitrospira sp.]